MAVGAFVRLMTEAAPLAAPHGHPSAREFTGRQVGLGWVGWGGVGWGGVGWGEVGACTAHAGMARGSLAVRAGCRIRDSWASAGQHVRVTLPSVP